jgi:hypothetical protein
MKKLNRIPFAAALIALLALPTLAAAQRTPGLESDISVQTPARDAVLDTTSVSISGRAKVATVRVSVYDSADHRVFNKSVVVKNGNWGTRANLKWGRYRLNVDSSLTKDRDGFRFQIKNGAGGTAGSENIVSITSPTQGQVVTGRSVPISGTSTRPTARVGIYDSANHRVFNKSVVVRNGRWGTRASLNNGTYRIVLDTHGQSDRDAVTFTVRGGNAESFITITSPRDGSTVSRDVSITGLSQGSTLRVQIFDSAKKRVFDKSLAVTNGHWSTAARLFPGSYRMVVDMNTGRDADVIHFKVRG